MHMTVAGNAASALDETVPLGLARDALRASESRYRRLFETALDGILLLNVETAQIEDANPYLVGLLGYSHVELLGKRLWEVGAFADVEHCKSTFLTLRESGYVRYENLPLRTKAGASLDVEFVSNTYECDGVQVVQCNIRDIRERKFAQSELLRLNQLLEDRNAKRTADLERANRELDAFSYSVSHDLRAPLRAIFGFSNLVVGANQDNLDTESVGYLQRIQASAQHMTLLIDDLLDLAHISRQVINPVRIDLSEMAHFAGAALVQRDPARAVALTVQPDMQIYGDPRLIRIALDNLLGNAWKFSARNTQTHIEIGQDTRNGETVFFVRDDGAGFDMRYAGKLFGAFERLHGQADFPGTGIGLSIVQRIVDRHAGRIWATGVVGQGATFYFTLSCAR